MPVKWTAKRPVGHPKKVRIEVELKRVVREEYEHWVSLEKKPGETMLGFSLWHESYGISTIVL